LVGVIHWTQESQFALVFSEDLLSLDPKEGTDGTKLAQYLMGTPTQRLSSHPISRSFHTLFGGKCGCGRSETSISLKPSIVAVWRPAASDEDRLARLKRPHSLDKQGA
jgi:hypothetical protein